MGDNENAQTGGTLSPPAQRTGSISHLEAKYSARLDALEISRATVDSLLAWVKFGGSFVAAVLALLAWWFGSSYSEATTNAQQAASSAFEREFFRNADNARDFSELRAKYEAAIKDLAAVESQLRGYAALRDIVGKVENFDPLELYASLDQEIELREKRTRAYSPDGTISISETLYDPGFRQKAAFVFQRLLTAVKEDAKTGKPKVEIVTLFNAAANASKVDMDFVSLELMEAAATQDKSKSPENEARLIRQRLTMSRISDDEALRQIQDVIKRVEGFNIHHVLSECFNIALRTADPAGMARMIQRELPKDLHLVSYPMLLSARLLYMGSTQKDWEDAERLKGLGIRALSQEPTSVRWYQSSQAELRRLSN